MERNMRSMTRNVYDNRSNYMGGGPRSLPHMGSKRHGPSRLSPPAQQPPMLPTQYNAHNSHNAHATQHDDLIHYIYESWNKVTRELERGSDDARYYQDVPRQPANFRPFNLEEWCQRRQQQTVARKMRS